MPVVPVLGKLEAGCQPRLHSEVKLMEIASNLVEVVECLNEILSLIQYDTTPCFYRHTSCTPEKRKEGAIKKYGGAAIVAHSCNPSISG